MKWNHIIALLFALSACGGNTDSRSYPYQDRPHNPMGTPQNPTQPFENPASESNAKITSMISHNDAQISDYINYRLNEWNLYNGDKGKDISRTDIADAVLFLLDKNKSVSDIEQHLGKNSTLFHMAAYVINNPLNSCFSGTGNPAQCFVDWRDKMADDYFDQNIASPIYENIINLNIQDAKFASIDGTQINFIINDTGQITSANITNDANTNTYQNHNGNNFYNIKIDGDEFIQDVFTYNSIGKDLGLSFSDFGTYDILTKNQDTGDVTQHIATDVPFAGGYESQQIVDIANDVQFTGRAVGTASNENQVVDLAGNATLNFDKDSGISTLGAQFDNWYDIVVKNDDTGSITFTNYKNAYDQVKLDSTPDADGVISSTGAKMDAHYYGYVPESGIPTEAAGLVQWTESPGGAKMDIAFGAK